MTSVILSLLLLIGEPAELDHPYDIPLEHREMALVEECMELFEVNVDPAYIYTMMYKESRFQPHVYHPSDYSYGYLQIVPTYSDVYYYSLIDEFPDLEGLESSVTDPETNIILGIYMLRYIAAELEYDEVNEDNFTEILTCYGKGMTGAQEWYSSHSTYTSPYTDDFYAILYDLMENGEIVE